MIAFRDCEYSLFISYAHDDDRAEFGWVQSLRTAIQMRLGKLDDHIVQLGLHLSHENGPTGGTLGSELQDRVAKSFGMLLVVGEKYADSEWCEQELKFFHATFGPAGIAGRLYIVAMSESAIQRAQQGAEWRRVMPPDQLWVPMFEELERDQPLAHRTVDGSPGFPGAFLKQASKVADRLIREIEKDVAVAEPAPPMRLPSPRAAQRRQIVIGPHTASLAARVQTIKSALEKAGADVAVIDRGALDNFDPDDDGRPLRPLLRAADVLVMPMTLEKPLKRELDGGHATLLAREWAAAGKAAQELVWFRPTDVVVAPEDLANARHLVCFNQLAPVCASETALVNHLFGVGASDAIRLHIENHPQEHAFKRLARQLEAAWAALPPDPARPMLRCVSLDLDELASASKDVAGVMLLLPVPLKNADSLRSQMDQVERLIPKPGTYPGCVAVLYDPPLAVRVPRHEWPHVQIRKSAVDPRLTIEDESKPELEEFLVDLWERHRRNAAAS